MIPIALRNFKSEKILKLFQRLGICLKQFLSSELKDYLSYVIVNQLFIKYVTTESTIFCLLVWIGLAIDDVIKK